jgi:chemotaxis signal transduction protein
VETDRPVLTLAVFPLGDGLVAFDAQQIAGLAAPEDVGELPLVELAALLELAHPPPLNRPRVLLPVVSPRRGILVENPQEIVEIAPDDLYPLPVLVKRTLSVPAVWGVARIGEALAALVDLAAID